MKLKHKPLMLGALSALALSGSLFAHHAFAETAVRSDPMDSLITRIATKFSLNKEDVAKVFTEERAARETEMQERSAERLSQAVTDGTLTAAQKDLIVAKQAEIKAKITEIRGMTDEAARKTAMEALRADTQKWASDNGISEKWLRIIGGKGGRGHGGPGEPGGMPPAERASSGAPTTVN